MKYQCSHCGRKFEAEEREFVECPGCFWSTSVKKEGEKQTSPPSVSLNSAPKQRFKPSPLLSGPVKSPKSFFVFVGVLVLAAVFWGVKLFFLPKNADSKAHVIIKLPQDESLKPAEKVAPVSSLTQDADAATNQDLVQVAKQLYDFTGPNPDEIRNIMERDASLRTGRVEALPSPPWTRAQYAEMLEEQQRFYKLGFPRSYRKKLDTLFKNEYEPGTAAYGEGRLLEARDHWISALAFPQYGDDPARHRGVALTMLRPFITDTLSKIAALNQMMVEGNARAREENINQAYGAYREHLLDQEWQAAWNESDRLLTSIERFSAELPPQVQVPPYPPSVRFIDRDIQVTLADIMVLPGPAVADVQPMIKDIIEKTNLAGMYLPAEMEKQKAFYKSAMTWIDQGEWTKAAAELEKIKLPPAFVKHVNKKIEILKKLAQQKLDSPSESS